MIIQKISNGDSNNSYRPSFSSLLDIVRTVGLIGSFIGLFVLLAIIGFAVGNKVLGIISIFYILSIILRIPETYQDVIPFESIATFGLLLAFVSSVPVAIFFVVTSEWLTKLISPFGEIEYHTKTLSETIALVIALLLFPIIAQHSSGNLLALMVYYQLVRYAIYMVMMVITSPAVIVTELFEMIMVVPMSVLGSYFILWLLGAPVLNYFGVTGWSLPPLVQYLKSKF